MELAALLLDSIGVWGLYLGLYLAIFSALTIGAYATVQHIVFGG
jgi:hypothetical protein